MLSWLGVLIHTQTHPLIIFKIQGFQETLYHPLRLGQVSIFVLPKLVYYVDCAYGISVVLLYKQRNRLNYL